MDSIASCEVYLYSMFTANVLKALPKLFNVRNYHEDVAFFVAVSLLLYFLYFVVVFNFVPCLAPI